MPTVDVQRVRRQLDRILASAAFADAERASSFLRFVVERKLEGHAGEIKESVIAVEVLNRPTSFDSKTDPIVRVEARRVRDRLSSYYEAEGGADPVLISLPKADMYRSSQSGGCGRRQRAPVCCGSLSCRLKTLTLNRLPSPRTVVR